MDETVEFSQLTSSIVRRWALLLLGTAVGAVLGLLVSNTRSPLYEATTEVLLAQAPQLSSPNGPPVATDPDVVQQLGLTLADMGQRSSLLEPVVAELGLNDGWEGVRRRVVVTLVPLTQLLEVKTRAESPSEAEQLADAVSTRLIEVGSGFTSLTSSQLAPARASLEPLVPDDRVHALVGGAAGFLLSAAGAVLLGVNAARQDQLMWDGAVGVDLGQLDLRRDHGEPSLVIAHPEAARREVRRASRVISNLRLWSLDGEIRTIAVAGQAGAEVQSRVAAHLATAMVHEGRPTVIVDARTDAPRQHHLAGVPLSPGLTDFLQDWTLDLTDVVAPTSVPALTVLPAGTQDAKSPSLHSSDGLRRLRRALEDWADGALLDVPESDLLGRVVADSGLVDGVIVVLRSRRLRASDRRHIEGLMRRGVPVTGFVTVALPLKARFRKRWATTTSLTLPRSKASTRGVAQRTLAASSVGRWQTQQVDASNGDGEACGAQEVRS